jgi:cardiolipin synthase
MSIIRSSAKRIGACHYYSCLGAGGSFLARSPHLNNGTHKILLRTWTASGSKSDYKRDSRRVQPKNDNHDGHENEKLLSKTLQGVMQGEKRQSEQEKKRKLLDIIFATFRQDIQSIPNIITLSRILCTPALGYCIIVLDNMEYAIAGCGLVAFSDWMDGFIAKRYHQKTILGTFLDPIADKWTIAVLSISLAYKGILPTPLVGLWLLRDTLLIGYTYWYMKHQSTQLQRTTVVEPTNISKVNTTLQFLAIACAMMTHNDLRVTLPSDDFILPTLYWTTALTTVLSGYSYLGYTAFAPITPTTTTTTTTTTNKEENHPFK